MCVGRLTTVPPSRCLTATPPPYPPFVEYLKQETQLVLGVSVKPETLSEDRQSSLGMPGSESFDLISRYTNKYQKEGSKSERIHKFM